MPSPQSLKRLLDVVGTALILLATAGVIWAIGPNRGNSGAGRPDIEDVSGLRIDADKLTNVKGRGSVAIVEFADYQCPFCGRHARETAPELERRFVAPGRIRYLYFHYPIQRLHPYAMKAGEAAECAGEQGAFWQMHERLFNNSQSLSRPDLITHARALSLDDAAFQACLDKDKAAAVLADKEEGVRLGVNSTPTFFVGTVEPDGSIELVKRINGAVSLDRFEAAIDDVHKAR